MTGPDPDLTALRSLDVADHHLDQDQQRRANELLERVIVTPALVASAAPAASRRFTRSRVLGLSLGSAALVAAVVLVPGLGGADTAYASWTATPTIVADGPDLDAVTSACRTELRTVDAQDFEVVLAERRGNYVLVDFVDPASPSVATCLVHNPAESIDVDDVSVGRRNPDPDVEVSPAPDQLLVTELAEVQDPAEPVAYTHGVVGKNVAGVTIHAGEYTAIATVKDGRYVAWWPGPAFVHPAGEKASSEWQPPHEAPALIPLTYDVRLNNGRILTGVNPYLP